MQIRDKKATTFIFNRLFMLFNDAARENYAARFEIEFAFVQMDYAETRLI